MVLLKTLPHYKCFIYSFYLSTTQSCLWSPLTSLHATVLWGSVAHAASCVWQLVYTIGLWLSHCCFLATVSITHDIWLRLRMLQIQETEKIVAPISDSPKPPPQRVTMTFSLVNSARCVAFVSTGGSKAPVLKVTFRGFYWTCTFQILKLFPWHNKSASARFRHKTN